MNRTQAENILKAYVSMLYARDAGGGSDAGNAINALREVILDAMAGYSVSTITTPSVTWPNTTPLAVPTYKPTITCEVES